MNLTLKTLSFSLIFCSVSLAAVVSARADCSPAVEANLLGCFVDTTAACKSSFPACDIKSINIDDVLDSAAARCCKSSSKKNAAKQAKSCIRHIAAKYNAVSRVADESLKPFAREAKAELLEFAAAGCSTGSN